MYYAIQGFKLSATVCGCSKPWVIRAFHTLALCHILWLIHRVGVWFIVSIFFLAVAPSQTVAAIALLLTLILCLIILIAIAMNIAHHCRCPCHHNAIYNFILFFKIIYIYIFYISFSVFLFFFFILFVDLSRNGLTSSTIGKIILSFFAPVMLFIVSLAVKEHFKTNIIEIMNTATDRRNVEQNFEVLIK